MTKSRNYLTSLWLALIFMALALPGQITAQNQCDEITYMPEREICKSEAMIADIQTKFKTDKMDPERQQQELDRIDQLKERINALQEYDKLLKASGDSDYRSGSNLAFFELTVPSTMQLTVEVYRQGTTDVLKQEQHLFQAGYNAIYIDMSDVDSTPPYAFGVKQ